MLIFFFIRISIPNLIFQGLIHLSDFLLVRCLTWGHFLLLFPVSKCLTWMLPKFLMDQTTRILGFMGWQNVTCKLFTASCKTEAILKGGFLLLDPIIFIYFADSSSEIRLVNTIWQDHKTPVHENWFLNSLFRWHDRWWLRRSLLHNTWSLLLLRCLI